MKLTRILWVLLATLTVAATVQAAAADPTGGKALIVHADPAGGTSAKKIPVPRGSTTYKLTVKDEDIFSDDVLFVSDWQPIPDGHKSVLVQFGWICVDGQVLGAAGNSGEYCAEILFCIEFNENGGSFEYDAGCACCGGK